MRIIRMLFIALALGAALAPAIGRADNPYPGCDPCNISFARK